MIDLELPPLPQQKVSLQLESDLRTAGRRTGWADHARRPDSRKGDAHLCRS